MSTSTRHPITRARSTSVRMLARQACSEKLSPSWVSLIETVADRHGAFDFGKGGQIGIRRGGGIFEGGDVFAEAVERAKDVFR